MASTPMQAENGGGMLWKTVVILIGILVTLTGGYVGLMRAAIGDNSDHIEKLSDAYHAIDRDVAVIKRDTSELRKTVETIQQEQRESQRLLRGIDRQIRRNAEP